MALARHVDDSSPQMSKRLACERCRSQKLRCIRADQNNTDPCARCVQAQVACVVRSRKAPGRPAGQKQTSVTTPRERSSDTQEGSVLLQHDASGTSNGQSTVFYHSSFDMARDSMLDDSCDFLLEEPTTMECGPIADFGLDIFDTSHHLNGFGEPLFLTNSTGTTCSPSSCLSTSSTTSGPSTFPVPERRIFSSDINLRLSSLYQSLVSHLAELRATPWDILRTLRLEPTACLNCQCHHHEPPAGSSSLGAAFDPLSSTFRLIVEFEHILSAMPAITQVSHPDNTTATTMVDHAPQMKISYALAAVSCHIQLVLVYDYILSYLAEQCASNRLVRDFFLNYAPPSLSLSGQALSPKRNLLGSTVVRLLKQRIGAIEAALGLPAEMAVSRRARREKSIRAGNENDSGSTSGRSTSSGTSSSSCLYHDRDMNGEDESTVVARITGEDAGIGGLVREWPDEPLLGVLRASLLTKEPVTGRPAVLDNVRARMLYLKQLT